MRTTRTKKNDPAARLALVLLRSLRGWDQGDLARAAKLAPSQVSVYDRGERPVPFMILEKAADAAGFPRALLGSLLQFLRSFLVVGEGWSRTDRVLSETMAAEMIGLVREMVEAISTRAPLIEARDEVEDLWDRLARRTPAEREMLVDELEEFQSLELGERVAAESRVRGDLALADLARRIAERAPRPEWEPFP